MCIIICEISSEPPHEFTTLNASKSISQMATAMGDKDTIVWRGFSCYRSEVPLQLPLELPESLTFELVQVHQILRAKAQAFAEMVADIESMTDLHAIYEDRLRRLGLDTSINKTRLKNNIIDDFLTLVFKSKPMERTLF